MLDAEADRLRLLQLAGPMPILDIVPLIGGNQPVTAAVGLVAHVVDVTGGQVRTHAARQLVVAAHGLLVHKHLIAERVKRFIMHDTCQCAPRRGRLVAEFVGETRRVIRVFAVIRSYGDDIWSD